MKIAIISDTHFGYTRFEEDAFIQAERAFLDAEVKADVIIYAGDVFDTKIPTLETINRAVEIFKKVKKPIFAIHGNHERRSKGMTNPAQLLANIGLYRYLHGTDALFELNNEKIQIFGLGNVPEELARVALTKSLENFSPKNDAFKIIVLHQSIKELIPHAEEEISFEDLEPLPFDLIINGHIHASIVKLGGRFLIPGSTVITQLKKDEVESRGYILYDTKTKTHIFVPVQCRQFFYEEFLFQEAAPVDIKQQVEAKIKELRNKDAQAIIRIKIKGTIKQGLERSGLEFVQDSLLYIDNQLNGSALKDKLDHIRMVNNEKLSVKEIAVKQLEERVKDRITLFSTRDLFDHLTQGVEETLEYLKSIKPP